jgi:tight adherence protein C
MNAIYLASLLLSGGFVTLLGYFRSLRPLPLYTKISPPQETKHIKRGSLKAAVSLLAVRQSPGKHDLDLLFQLPDFLDLFSVALSSGDSVYSALRRVVPRMLGRVSKEFENILLALDLGSDFETELNQMSLSNQGNQLSEVANRLLLAVRRGTPLAEMLASQATFIRNDLHHLLLKQAGKNETRMMVPLVFLILPVTILFAIFPSLEMLGGSYL